MTNTLRGVLWMVSAALFFAAMLSCGRALGARYGAFEIVVLHTAVSTLLMVPWLARGGLAQLRTRRPVVHGLRAVVAMIALASMFLAVRTLPVGDATDFRQSARSELIRWARLRASADMRATPFRKYASQSTQAAWWVTPASRS